MNIGFFLTLGLSISWSYHMGESYGYFQSGRTTMIISNDLKFVVGLDAKKVDYSLDIKGYDLGANLGEVRKSEIKAYKDGLKVEGDDLVAKVTSSLNLLM